MLTEAIERYKEQNGLEAFRPKVALFDMDGVLYDSMGHHSVAWHDTMARFGYDMSYEDGYAMEGMRGIDTIRAVAEREGKPHLSDEECLRIYDIKSKAYQAMGVSEIIPNVKDVHRTLIEQGFKIGVVTGSGQKVLLDRIMRDFSDSVTEELITSALDYKIGKPNPEPYLMGIRKASALLGEPLSGTDVIVFENAPLGVQAAKGAGCFTIAVNTGPLPDSALKDAGADVVFKNMKELDEASRRHTD